MTEWRVIEGDCRERLAELEPESVQTCVTSPPYFGLRDYGHDGQVGLEPTPDEYVAELRGVPNDDAMRSRFWLLHQHGALREMRGVVYFVSAGSDGPIKIGFTRGVLKRRMADLQLTSPVRLRALWAVKGGQDRERRIHVELAAHRLHGEWFEREPVLEYLDRLVKPELGLRLVEGGKR